MCCAALHCVCCVPYRTLRVSCCTARCASCYTALWYAEHNKVCDVRYRTHGVCGAAVHCAMHSTALCVFCRSALCASCSTLTMCVVHYSVALHCIPPCCAALCCIVLCVLRWNTRVVVQEVEERDGNGARGQRLLGSGTRPPPALRANLVAKGQQLLAIHMVAPKAPENFFFVPLAHFVLFAPQHYPGTQP